MYTLHDCNKHPHKTQGTFSLGMDTHHIQYVLHYIIIGPLKHITYKYTLYTITSTIVHYRSKQGDTCSCVWLMMLCLVHNGKHENELYTCSSYTLWNLVCQHIHFSMSVLRVCEEIVTIPPTSGNVAVTVVEWVGLCKTNH